MNDATNMGHQDLIWIHCDVGHHFSNKANRNGTKVPHSAEMNKLTVFDKDIFRDAFCQRSSGFSVRLSRT